MTCFRKKQEDFNLDLKLAEAFNPSPSPPHPAALLDSLHDDPLEGQQGGASDLHHQRHPLKIHIPYVANRKSERKSRNRLVKSYNGNISGFQKQISIFQQNVQGKSMSLPDQIACVETIISKLCPDILIVSEADTEHICNWSYPGYVAHKGKLLGQKLARVSALVRTSIKHTVSHLEVEVPNVVISFLVNGKQHRCTGIYREWNFAAQPNTPRQDQEERWCQFEDAWFLANRRCKHSCLIGDMNFDYLGGDTPHQRSLDPIRTSVWENIVMKGWKQLIDKPTRHQGKDKASMLDHIYYNAVENVKYSLNKPYTDGDHNCVGIVIRTSKFIPVDEVIKTRCFGKVDWTWAQYLVNYSSKFYKVFSYTDPNEIVDFLEGELLDILDTVAPERLVTIKPGRASWMTSELEDLLNYRDSLKEAWIKSGLQEDNQRWREVKKDVRSRVRSAKKTQVLADLEVKDLKKRWERVRRITGAVSNSGPPTELLVDGKTVKEPAEIAHILNTGFREKVDGIMAKVKADPARALEMFEDYALDIEEKHGKLKGFSFREIDCDDARAAIKTLKNTQSIGTDGIPTVLYKKLAWVLAPYMAYLVNQIFRTSVFPDRWREGIITPIFKKGARNLKSNYRPVVITNSMAKIWERIANSQISEYATRYGLIHDSQHAYLRNRGCNSYWHDMTSKISRGKDLKKKVSVQIWDLQSAFNLCQRSILLPKLQRLGFSKESLELLTGFLSNRKICTKIEDSFSSMADVDVGSPEGCILSPQIYNLCLSDFSSIKKRVEKVAKEGFAITKVDPVTEEENIVVTTAPSLDTEAGVYADDSGFTSSADTEEELRDAVVEIDRQTVDYFTVNGMSVNTAKSDLISIMNRFSQPLRIGKLESQSQIRLLGLTMTDKLSFMPHAVDVVSKIAAKLPGIVRMRNWASDELVKATAEACLISHMTYCMEVWAYEKRVQTILQRCLNRIMRDILGRGPREPVAQMLADLGWLSIPNQVEYRSLFWIRKVERENSSPFTSSILHVSQTERLTRGWRYEPKFMSQTLATSQLFCHRGASLYSSYNLFPQLLEFEEYKEVIRDKILARNGNHNI